MGLVFRTCDVQFLALLTCQSAELMRWVASVRPSVHLSVRPSIWCGPLLLPYRKAQTHNIWRGHYSHRYHDKLRRRLRCCQLLVFYRRFCGEYTTNAWPDKAMATHAYVCYAARQTTFDIRSIYGSDSLPGQERLHLAKLLHECWGLWYLLFKTTAVRDHLVFVTISVCS